MNAVFPDGQVVMVVEDELLIAATLEAALTEKGYRVLGPVATVPEAIELLQTSQPDVALIDYRLATTTTEALLPSLASRSIPVCVLTGYSASQLPAAYAGHTVLEKPFRIHTLMAALNKISI
ncbi:MAG: response regulator [Burkholderiales bacterium]